MNPPIRTTLRRTDAGGWAALAGLLMVLACAGPAVGLPRPFGTGERLTFDIYYGPLKAGTAQMEVGDRTLVRGRECLHVVSTAESGPVVSTFFRVRDRVESWIDLEHLRPVRYEKHLREGRYECDHVVDFFHDQGVARTANETLSISEHTRDALSSLYWVRTLDLEPGRRVLLSSTSPRRSYDLAVEVTHTERIRTPAGEFDCVVVEPQLAEDGGIFKQKGRMWVWLTDDALHLPVQMVSEVAIGSIKAVLVDQTLGRIAGLGDGGTGHGTDD